MIQYVKCGAYESGPDTQTWNSPTDLRAVFVGLAGVYIIDDLAISFSKDLTPLKHDENSGRGK